MDRSLLDNSVWHALNSYHRHLGVNGEKAARYQADVFLGAGMPGNTPGELDELRNLVRIDEAIGVAGPMPKDMDGWQAEAARPIPQMICEELKPGGHIDAIPLTAADVPEMLELVELAQPGPFLPRTIEMGAYIGLRQEGRLVAMAGERVHLPGFCEISAVCTHPDYRGRGYAGALTTMAAERIIARGEIPYLHLLPPNDPALRLYQKLGFHLRREISFTMLKRIE